MASPHGFIRDSGKPCPLCKETKHDVSIIARIYGNTNTEIERNAPDVDGYDDPRAHGSHDVRRAVVDVPAVDEHMQLTGLLPAHARQPPAAGGLRIVR